MANVPSRVVKFGCSESAQDRPYAAPHTRFDQRQSIAFMFNIVRTRYVISTASLVQVHCTSGRAHVRYREPTTSTRRGQPQTTGKKLVCSSAENPYHGAEVSPHAAFLPTPLLFVLEYVLEENRSLFVRGYKWRQNSCHLRTNLVWAQLPIARASRS